MYCGPLRMDWQLSPQEPEPMDCSEYMNWEETPVPMDYSEYMDWEITLEDMDIDLPEYDLMDWCPCDVDEIMTDAF